MNLENTAVVWKVLSLAAYWLGMVSRVLLPYVKQYWEEGGNLPFDWNYVKGQLLGSLIGFFGLLAADGGSLLAQIGALGVALAFFAGYVSAQIGREGHKFTAAGRSFMAGIRK